MRRFLLASVAASGLMLAGLPAFAQQAPVGPVPANPPIAAAAPDADVTADEQVGNNAQIPSAQASGDAASSVAPPRTSGAGQVTAQNAAPTDEVPSPVPRSTTQAPAETAQTAPRVAPTNPPSVTAQAPAAPRTADAAPGVQTASAAPMSASSVCQARTTSVHFGGGSALSRQNGNAIEQAADSASVCALDNITIAASGSENTATRRANAIRALLVRQGVPEEKIRVEAAADGLDSSTGQADVRMNFAGMASASTGASLAPTVTTGANAAASATTQVAANVPRTPAPRPAMAPPAPRAPAAAPPAAMPPASPRAAPAPAAPPAAAMPPAAPRAPMPAPDIAPGTDTDMDAPATTP